MPETLAPQFEPGSALPVCPGDIVAARRRIRPHVRHTPAIESEWLTGAAGGPVHLKLEALQVSRSFKVRGALNALMLLQAGQVAGSQSNVVTASAGNHGRAVAWAAERLGLHAVVFTPRTAPLAKRDAIRRHGADLRDVADDYEHAERLAQAFARERQCAFVSPYDHPHVIAGAGTIALELAEDLPDLEVLVVPIGGGGLISGNAVAARALFGSVEIVGVEVEASAAFTAARAAGRIVPITVGRTLADGLGGNVDPATITWPFIRDLVSRIVTVPEDALRGGMRALLREERLAVEGAGAVGAAALAAGLIPLEGRRAAVLLTGANVDLPENLAWPAEG